MPTATPQPKKPITWFRGWRAGAIIGGGIILILAVIIGFLGNTTDHGEQVLRQKTASLVNGAVQSGQSRKVDCTIDEGNGTWCKAHITFDQPKSQTEVANYVDSYLRRHGFSGARGTGVYNQPTTMVYNNKDICVRYFPEFDTYNTYVVPQQNGIDFQTSSFGQFCK